MKALVTGGGGFLGGGIVRALRAQGHAVSSLARGAYPELEALGVTVHRGDISGIDAVNRAVEGCDTVFHVAAKAGVWGPYADYYQANVLGTQNVLEACQLQQVPKLVYTSTPSVVFDGHDENGIDESTHYPPRHLNAYAATKALAEQTVLAANGTGLATVALRPHLVWGPDDNHLVPRILARARAGKLKLVGPGDNLVDSTWIDNAVDAHLAAAAELTPGAACAGRAYFISNGEPLPMRDLLNGILASAGLPPVTRSVSPAAAYAAGAILEGLYHLTGKQDEPMMTRFVARQLATAHWFQIDAARRDFGYAPRVSNAEGFQKLGVWLREERQNHKTV